MRNHAGAASCPRSLHAGHQDRDCACISLEQMLALPIAKMLDD